MLDDDGCLYCGGDCPNGGDEPCDEYLDDYDDLYSEGESACE